MKDPLGVWYSVPAIAARFVTGLDSALVERTIAREIDRQPALKAAARRKFGVVWLPWWALEAWLSGSAPVRQKPPQLRVLPTTLQPICARSEGELTRRLSALAGGNHSVQEAAP